jgi:hypothetical protein
MSVEFDENVSRVVNKINLNVAENVNYFSKSWHDSNDKFPEFNNIYSIKEKLKCEAELEKFFDVIKKDICKKKNPLIKSRDLEDKYSVIIRTFLKERIYFEDGQLDVLFSKDFIKVSSEFINMAYSFDQLIGQSEVFQACRNVWTMNWVQLLLGIPIELTPSIFAYSMLYPYTDNYLDDPNVCEENKHEFNQRLTARLLGDNIKPIGRLENIIYDLIEMIEIQYNRMDYPQVHESLLAIHSSQSKSLGLMNSDNKIGKKNLLDISLEKGGTSVLADGYLAAGFLTESQQKYLFGYGAYLQLIDDLQDVKDDLSNGFNTIFSDKSAKHSLDILSNRLFHFGKRVIPECNLLHVNKSISIIEIMRKTNELLIIGAIGSGGNCFSSSYLSQIEDHSPVRFSFLQKHQNDFIQSSSLFTQLSYPYPIFSPPLKSAN